MFFGIMATVFNGEKAMPKNYVRRSTSQSMSWAFRQLPFWERVKQQTIISESGCHLFTGHKDECGYGRIRAEDGKLTRVHRAVYLRVYGPLLDKQVVRHTCDTPNCINPAHLIAGTQADNICDMDRRGRRRTLFGSAQSQAKLTESQIPMIRQLIASGKTCASIGRMYEVSEGLIRSIKKDRVWRHVPK